MLFLVVALALFHHKGCRKRMSNVEGFHISTYIHNLAKFEIIYTYEYVHFYICTLYVDRLAKWRKDHYQN
jgi:hypothetical protein